MQSILFSFLLTNLVSTIVMILLWKQSYKRIQGVFYWVLTIGFQMLGIFLLLLRGQVPDWLSIVVANLFIITGMFFGLEGVLKFLSIKRNQVFNIGLLVMFFILQICFTYLYNNKSFRIYNISIVSLIICFQAGGVLIFKVSPDIRKYSRMVGYVFIGYCILGIIRIINEALLTKGSNDIFIPSGFDVIIMLVYQLLLILLTFSLALMFNQQLISDISSSEEKFSKAFYSSPYSVAITKFKSGEFIDVNKIFLKIFQYNYNEIIGKTIEEIQIWMHEDDRMKFIDELKINGNVENREMQFRSKNGKVVVGVLSSEIIEIKNETCILSSFNDITHQKNTEKALKESEKQLKSFFENSIDAILLSSPDGRIFSANPATCEMFGYTEAEIVSLGRNGIVDLEDPRFSELLDKRSRMGKIKGEITMVKKDGTRFPVEISAALYTNILGEKRSIMIIHDITERKESEEKLKHRDLLIKEMGKVARIGGWEYNVITGKDYFTDETALIYDLDLFKNSLDGIGFSFYTKESRILLENAIKIAIDEGKSYDLELELISAKGIKKWIHAIGNPVFDNNKVVLLRGSFQDISDRKRIEDEIKKLNDELEQRVFLRTLQLENANKELEAFTYSVSHDLRSPLRAISGLIKILIEDYEQQLDEEGRKLCHVIMDKALNLGNLIDDLLSFSKLNKAIMNPFFIDIKQMVENIIYDIGKTIDISNVKVKIGNLNKIHGDATLIKQVWINLIENALKFTSPKPERLIEIDCYTEGSDIIYFIKDNGVGFDMNYYAKLFGVFQRLHSTRDFDGTGVGLAIVKRIIERHGGRVWATSELNVGATFYFSLPLENKTSYI